MSALTESVARRTRIATDSVADIPPAIAEELGVAVVPCHIHFGDEVYRDGVDLKPHLFYSKMERSSELPRTSQPPVHYFVETYQRLLADGSDILSIHTAGNLSGAVNAAWAAAQMLPDPSRVEVIDTGQLSMGLGWAVVKAARLAAAGVTKDEISRAVRALLPRLRAAAMIDELDNLYKGGRITQVTAVLGTALHIKPLLSVQEGRVSVVGQVRTRSRAVKRLAALVQDWGPLDEVAIMHTGAEELAQTLVGLLGPLLPGDQVMVEPAGPALATHLGLGAVGVCAVLADGG